MKWSDRIHRSTIKLILLLSAVLVLCTSSKNKSYNYIYNSNKIVFVLGRSSFVYATARLRQKRNTGRKTFIYAMNVVDGSSGNGEFNVISSNRASPTKTMEFLKRIGKIGNNNDNSNMTQNNNHETDYITNAIGVDEGNAGSCTTTSAKNVAMRQSVPRNNAMISDDITDTSTSDVPSFCSCVETGIIDDMSNTFPYTNTGTRWGIFT
jgi:hypothetical protein